MADPTFPDHLPASPDHSPVLPDHLPRAPGPEPEFHDHVVDFLDDDLVVEIEEALEEDQDMNIDEEDPKEDQGMDFENDDEVEEWEDNEDWLIVIDTLPRATTPVRPDTPPLSFVTSGPLLINPIMLPNHQITTLDFLPWIPPTQHKYQHNTYKVGGPSSAAPEAPHPVGRPLSIVASRVALHHQEIGALHVREDRMESVQTKARKVERAIVRDIRWLGQRDDSIQARTLSLVRRVDAFEQKTRDMDMEDMHLLLNSRNQGQLRRNTSTRLRHNIYLQRVDSSAPLLRKASSSLRRSMMNEVDIENLTIEQYLMLTQENQAQGMARTKTGSTTLGRSKVLENKQHPNKLKTNAYFPSRPPCFKPSQPLTKDTHEPLEKYLNNYDLTTPNSHNEDEEVSSDEDVDEWLNVEMSKLLTRQDKEEKEDALIDIIKTVVEECKSIYKEAQMKAPSSRTIKIQGVSFVTEEEEDDSLETLPCQLPPKEINPGSFTLPCTIGNLKLYAMADLGIGVNVMPKSLFEHLKLADLKETSMVVEMADMTKKTPLGIVENILVKIDKREISLGIGKEKVKFDMNGGICHSRVPFKKIYMASSIQEREYCNPLEIENDSHVCLLLEQSTPPCRNESIDTVDSSNDMQELEGSQEDEVGSHLLENVVSRWHIFKPVCVTFKDCEKDCGKWPTCNPDLSFCSGYDAIYEKEENGMLKQWIRKFEIEIEQLANEYDLRVGMKKYTLDDILEKCERFQDTACQWHDEGFEEDKRWESGIEKTCYTSRFVKNETFEVKRYFFKNKKSFVRIIKQLDDAQPLGRVNGSRFMGMIRKEMDEEGRTTRKT
ncbi:phospholipase-like protein [Tanacetum coccineum]